MITNAEESPRSFNQRRYAVALCAAGRTVASVAREAGVSERYLYQVLQGRCSMSVRMEAAIRQAVGDDGWRYALAQSDVLPCTLPSNHNRQRGGPPMKT